MMEKEAASVGGHDTPEPLARASSHSKPSATPSLTPYVASSVGGPEGFDDQADFQLEDQDLPLAPRSEDNKTECPSEVSDDVVERQVATDVSGVNVLAWMREATDADYEEPDRNGGYEGGDQQYGGEGYQDTGYPEEEGFGEEDQAYYGGSGGGDGAGGGGDDEPPGGPPGGGGGPSGGGNDDEEESEDEEASKAGEPHEEDDLYDANKMSAQHHAERIEGQVHMDPQVSYAHHDGLPVEYAAYDGQHDPESYQYHEGMEAMQGSLDGDLDHMDYMQHNLEDEQHLTHEQRQQYREERKRMREDAERTKKRRKKWVLPLDEDAIESERRRKVSVRYAFISVP